MIERLGGFCSAFLSSSTFVFSHSIVSIYDIFTIDALLNNPKSVIRKWQETFSNDRFVFIRAELYVLVMRIYWHPSPIMWRHLWTGDKIRDYNIKEELWYITFLAHYTIIFTIFAYHLIYIYGKSNQQNKRGVDRKKKLSKDGLQKSLARVFDRKFLRLQSSSASLELLFQITEILQVNPKEWINTPDEYFFHYGKT